MSSRSHLHVCQLIWPVRIFYFCLIVFLCSSSAHWFANGRLMGQLIKWPHPLQHYLLLNILSQKIQPENENITFKRHMVCTSSQWRMSVCHELTTLATWIYILSLDLSDYNWIVAYFVKTQSLKWRDTTCWTIWSVSSTLSSSLVRLGPETSNHLTCSILLECVLHSVNTAC